MAVPAVEDAVPLGITIHSFSTWLRYGLVSKDGKKFVMAQGSTLSFPTDMERFTTSGIPAFLAAAALIDGLYTTWLASDDPGDLTALSDALGTLITSATTLQTYLSNAGLSAFATEVDVAGLITAITAAKAEVDTYIV